MATEVVVPSLGESVTQAILIKWYKKDGERVAQDEPVCELETDKANADMNAPTAGILRRVKNEGDTVQVGEVIARVDPAGAATAAPAPAPAQAAAGGPAATAAPTTPAAGAPGLKIEDLSPATRRIVEESKVDPSGIPGTGRGGRLTKEDVQGDIASKGPGAQGNGERSPAAPPAAAPQPQVRHETPAALTAPPKTPGTTSMTFDERG